MTAVMPTPTLTAAYLECETITRTQARNFFYGIRLLAPDKRAALCSVYALARRIDDIGDGPLPVPAKRAALDELRRRITSLGDSGDPVLLAVGDVARRMPLPVEAFGELIDGVEIDLAIDTGGHRFADFDALVTYCRCVAGSIGRLCVGVFGTTDPATALPLADTLGIGLQQINILRDIREDLINRRVYLPQSELRAAGVDLRLAGNDGSAQVVGGVQLTALIRRCGERARRWYDDGIRLVDLLDRRSAACTLAMAGIYSRLLHRIMADPAAVTSQRLSVPSRSKAAIAAGALLGRSA